MAENKQAPQQDETLDNLNNSLTSAGEAIVKNSKMIGWCVGGVAVVALAILAYIFFVQNPKEEKSIEAFNNVEATATTDSASAVGYKKVADEYGSTVGGNLAALAAGEALYDEGKYEEAIKYLKEFDGKGDEAIEAGATCMIGDCYVNLKKYDEAISYFDKAIVAANGNGALIPRFIDKKATVFAAQKKYDKALECYETIKKDYPSYSASYNVDAYIAREKARAGK